MPKVYLTENDRARARLTAWVYGQLGLNNMTITALAEKMGISHQALSRKLRDRSFSFTDYAFFVKEFQPTEREQKEIIGN